MATKSESSWSHSVLGMTTRKDGITVTDLCRIWNTSTPEIFERVLSILAERGLVTHDGEIWKATENGRSRYVIDDNCRGW